MPRAMPYASSHGCGFSPSDIRKLRECFEFWDRNQTGNVEALDALHSLELLGVLDQQQIRSATDSLCGNSQEERIRRGCRPPQVLVRPPSEEHFMIDWNRFQRMLRSPCAGISQSVRAALRASDRLGPLYIRAQQAVGEHCNHCISLHLPVSPWRALHPLLCG